MAVAYKFDGNSDDSKPDDSQFVFKRWLALVEEKMNRCGVALVDLPFSSDRLKFEYQRGWTSDETAQHWVEYFRMLSSD